MARPPQQGQLGGIALLAAGFSLVIMTLGGCGLGLLVDHVAHTAPWGVVIGLLAGFIVGVWDVYRISIRVLANEPLPSEKNTGNSSKTTEGHEDRYES